MRVRITQGSGPTDNIRQNYRRCIDIKPGEKCIITNRNESAEALRAGRSEYREVVIEIEAEER